jgi:hypothetical protein
VQPLVRASLSALASEFYYPDMAKQLHDENRFLQARDPEIVRELTAAQTLALIDLTSTSMHTCS